MFTESLVSDPLVLFHGASIIQHESILQNGLIGKPLIFRDAVIEFEHIRKSLCEFEISPGNQDWIYHLPGTVKMSWTVHDYHKDRPPVFLSFVPTTAYCAHVGGELATGAFDFLRALKSIVEAPEQMELERLDTYEVRRSEWQSMGFRDSQINPYKPVDIGAIEAIVNKYDSFIRSFEQLRTEHTNGVVYAVRLNEADLKSADIQNHCISVPSISREQIVEFRIVDLKESYDSEPNNHLRIDKREKLAALREILLTKKHY